ncbi:molybdopterin synthase sulfur carrier subunit [Alicyclobacillus hesperidum subsp. aegles]|uniref:molybdenum cofactor biosynthesis protein n=1 Tax=Alicyclobacillus hesperidum TaxID=89784 RepID=UPI00222DB80A|nr:molybdenum cofactor biosynthesis protein MoaE [Alicyclobacillus hesperidum]GLG00993.1 molybdopterin synthase sulfur carrier subunit [Alicyclobacillus hesperidum subsp. aegles]
MQIEIRLFANLKEIMGQDKIRIDVPDGLPAGELASLVASRYPQLEDALANVLVAKNHALARPADTFRPTDEIAFIPPVGGGEVENETPWLRVSEQPLVVEEAYKLLENPKHGGTVLFVGTVREWTGQRHTDHLFYEAYPAMVYKQLAAIQSDVERRFPGIQTLQWHRIGKLVPTDIAVICGASSPHRAAAFEAANMLIERLKREAAIWKKEFFADGSTAWRANP